MMLDCIRRHPPHRRLADPSSGETHDTQQRLVIAAVDRQTQVPQRVLDLLALVERRASVDTIRDIQFAQFPFDHPTLRVRAVQHGERLKTFVFLPLNKRSDTQRLRPIVHIRLQSQRLPRFFLRVNGLLDLMDILVNQRVSGIDDRLRRAVVTLQLKQLSLRINALKIENITDVGAAERVDTLRIVAHHADIVLRLGELLDQHKLDIVRILVLVHQDVLELLLVFLAHVRTLVQQAQHVDQQVVKIHRVRGFQTRLVQGIDGRKLIHPRLAIFAQQLLVHPIVTRVDTAVLRHRDPTLHRAGLVDLLVQTALFADGFDDGFHIGRIVDREVARVSYSIRVRAYQARAHAMERSHHQVAISIVLEEPLHSLLHLPCGFVSERQRHDPRSRNTLLQQVRDAIGQDASLTRSCSCHHEQCTFRTRHRLPLRTI